MLMSCALRNGLGESENRPVGRKLNAMAGRSSKEVPSSRRAKDSVRAATTIMVPEQSEDLDYGLGVGILGGTGTQVAGGRL